MASIPNNEARVRARYWIETAYPLQQAAETMAGEQSTGTFVRVPGETDELRERHAAQVEAILELDSVSTPSLPGAGSHHHNRETRLREDVDDPGAQGTAVRRRPG